MVNAASSIYIINISNVYSLNEKGGCTLFQQQQDAYIAAKRRMKYASMTAQPKQVQRA